jgi:hypothetical protein
MIEQFSIVVGVKKCSLDSGGKATINATCIRKAHCLRMSPAQGENTAGSAFPGIILAGSMADKIFPSVFLLKRAYRWINDLVMFRAISLLIFIICLIFFFQKRTLCMFKARKECDSCYPSYT